MQTGEIIGQSAETQRVFAALVAAQKAAPEALGKVDYNDFAKFDYVSADRMIMAGRKALTGAGLALVPLAQEIGPGVGEAPGRLRTTYRVVHESGQYLDLVFETPIVTKKGSPEDKAGFGAATESLGYLYRGLLAIGRLDPREVTDVSGRDDRDYEPAPKASRPTPPPPANDTRPAPGSAAQLADEYIAAIEEMRKVDWSVELLEQLEQLPPAIRAANLPPAELRRITDVYNPFVVELRAHLRVPA